jgi:diaminopimelate epimerase
MNVKFSKFHGTGNDFVLIDDREEIFPINNVDLIKQLCHRRFGIGADGLMLVRNDSKYDFRMVYFNSDGNESTMCGNGGRCIVAFSYQLGIINTNTEFIAVDGPHEAEVVKPDYIRLKMIDVNEVEIGNDYFYLNTGSPHYVSYKTEFGDNGIINDAHEIRYSDRFKVEGTNVNFVKLDQDELFVRTYERGVENETYSCGTGVVASAISAGIKNKSDKNSYDIKTLGGNLKVAYNANFEKNEFNNIWLEGPAAFVYSGTFEI